MKSNEFMTFNSLISIQNERRAFSADVSYIHGDDSEDITKVSLRTETLDNINTVKVQIFATSFIQSGC